RDFPEKWMPVFFADYMPPSLISPDVDAILEFLRDHRDIVIKPFYGFAGHGVFRLTTQDKNARELIEAALPAREPLMAQKFLPEVKDQDRRIILIDGEFAGLFGRIPAAGEIRANMRVGGTPVKGDITPRQREMCEA